MDPFKYQNKYSIFDAIANKNPDYFVWLGDAIYATNRFLDFSYVLKPHKDIEKSYSNLKNNESYKLLANQTNILGIWDDHDSAYENVNYFYRNLSDKQKLRDYYLNFIDEPKDSIRYTRDDGIYQSYYLDSQQQVKLILLDMWTNYTEEDALGPKQLDWLKSEVFDDETAHIFLQANGSPIVNNLFMGGDRIPVKNRNEIFEIINAKKKFFLLIVGEMHFASLNQHNYKDQRGKENDLYELITSGMSHYFDKYDINFFVADHYLNSTMIYNGLNFAGIDLHKNETDCQADIMIYNEKGEMQVTKILDCNLETFVDVEARKDDSYWGINLAYQWLLVKQGYVGHLYFYYNYIIENKIIFGMLKAFTAGFYVLVHRTTINIIFS